MEHTNAPQPATSAPETEGQSEHKPVRRPAWVTWAIGGILSVFCAGACLFVLLAGLVSPFRARQALDPAAPDQPATGQPAGTASASPASLPAPTRPIAPKGGGEGFACFVFPDYYSGLTCLTNAGWQSFKPSVTYIKKEGSEPLPVYGHDSPLGEGPVQGLAACPDGSLVVATNSTLSRFDGSSLTVIDTAGPGDSFDGPLACGPDGKIVIENFPGLDLYDGQAWTHTSTGELEAGLADLEFAPDGSVWVAGGALWGKDYLLRFDGSSWTKVPVSKDDPVLSWENSGSLDGHFFYDLVMSAHRQVLARDTISVSIFDGMELVPVETSVDEGISSVAIDGQDQVWIGTYEGGLYTQAAGEETWITRSEGGLPSNRIRNLLVDANDRLWVGTDWGLAVLDGGEWTAYHMSNSGLLDNQIDKLVVTGAGPSLPAPEEKPAGAITGRLLQADGSPLANAAVEVCVEFVGQFYDPAGTPCTGQPFSTLARTDANGNFTIGDLPAGYYIFTFDGGERWVILTPLTDASKRLLVEPGQTKELGDLTLPGDPAP